MASAKASTVPLPSDRKFGTLFTAVFGAFGAYLWWHGSARYAIALGLSGLLLLVTVAAPKVLHPLNRAWMGLSLILNRLVSPVVLGFLFFIVFTPLAGLMRLFKRDTMQRGFDSAAGTYWIPRNPPNVPPDSFREQG